MRYKEDLFGEHLEKRFRVGDKIDDEAYKFKEAVDTLFDRGKDLATIRGNLWRINQDMDALRSNFRLELEFVEDDKELDFVFTIPKGVLESIQLAREAMGKVNVAIDEIEKIVNEHFTLK